MSSLPLPHPASPVSRSPLLQRRTVAVLAIVALLHVAAFVALRYLSPPTPATMEPAAMMATLIPLAPQPTAAPPAPPTPKPPTPKPPPPKPRVPPPPPRPQPKTAITPPKPKPEPAAAPAAPAEPAPAPPAPTPPAHPGPSTAAPTSAAPAGPVEGLAVSCSDAKPVYPAQSARMGEEGTVKLRVIINERGVVDKVTVQQSSGSSRLDNAARDAVLAMHCRPPTVNGKPVVAAAIKPITFRLDE